MQGWIKIHRKILEWEWYDDSKMVHLFLHILIKANHEETTWKGVTIKRGQLITGRVALSAQTGISEKAIRICLEKLKSTKDVAIKTTNKYSLVTILNYDFYQDQESKGQQKGQPEDQRGASETATPKEGKKTKEERIKEFYDLEVQKPMTYLEDYKTFYSFIIGENEFNTPVAAVFGMEQVTSAQFDKLMEKSIKKEGSIVAMLTSIMNKPAYVKDHKNLNLTLHSWLDRK